MAKINAEHTIPASTFYQVYTLSPVSSWASQTTACRSESRRLACFSLQNPQIKPQLHKTPAGKVCLCNSQGWGSMLLFFTKLCSPYYWGNLALNQGQRRSTSWLLITKEMLTYFQRSEKEMLRAAVATCETPPLKLRRLRNLRWKSKSWGRNQDSCRLPLKPNPFILEPEWSGYYWQTCIKTKDSHGIKVMVKSAVFPGWRL